MKLPRYSCLLSVLLLLSGKVSASAADPADYLPLKIGHEWTLDFTIKTSQEAKTTLTLKITGTAERDGKTYFTENASVAAEPDKANDILVRKDETGFYSIDKREADGKEQVDIQLPFVAGRSWNKSFSSKDAKETEVGIETIVVGGKSYEQCYHLHVDALDNSLHADLWHAPNIGLIKAEFTASEGVKGNLVLREFKPAKE